MGSQGTRPVTQCPPGQLAARRAVYQRGTTVVGWIRPIPVSRHVAIVTRPTLDYCPLKLNKPLLLRGALVVLLLGGAYLALRPWTACAFTLPGWSVEMMRLCSFGSGNPTFDADGPGQLWPYPLIASIYVVAALTLLFTRRVHLDSPAP